jgi:hypothetical protein
MTTRNILAAVLGGFIVFAYMAVAWMVLPHHTSTLNAFPDEPALKQTLSGIKERGIYTIPSPQAADSSTPVPGPHVFAAVNPAPNLSMGAPMGIGLVNQIVCALIIVWLLGHTRPLGYGARVCFASAIGLLIGLAGSVPNWNWWGFSTPYMLAEIADQLIGWTLAGLAMAKVVR